MVDLICDNCNSKYQITEHNRRRRIKNNTPNFCKSCMNRYMHDNSRKTKTELEIISKKISD